MKRAMVEKTKSLVKYSDNPSQQLKTDQIADQLSVSILFQLKEKKEPKKLCIYKSDRTTNIQVKV